MKLISKGLNGLINDRTDHPVERPIVIEPIERVIGPADRVNVPKGTKYSELTPLLKLELHKSDALKRDSKQLEITSPEFDVLTLLTGTKSARNLLDIARRKKTYTGVPHMLINGEYKDEVFLTTNDKFNIWTSDNYDFVLLFAGNKGKTFAVFGRPDKLYKLPKLPENYPIIWSDTPYKIEGKKIVFNDNSTIVKEPIKVWRTHAGIESAKENIYDLSKVNPLLTLLLHSSKNYLGIKVKNVLDGPIVFNELVKRTPADEWVYKARANVIKAPLETTKLDLIKKDDVINLISKLSTIVGHNIIDNDK